MNKPTHRPPVADWHSDLDHFDPEFISDPYPIYEELRDQCPVAHSDRYGGMTWLTKASDVSAAANDTEVFSSRRTIISEISTDRRGLILPPINIDPPDHTDYRRLLLPFSLPRRRLIGNPRSGKSVQAYSTVCKGKQNLTPPLNTHKKFLAM